MPIPRTPRSTDRVADAMSDRTPLWESARNRIEAMRRTYLRIERDDRFASALSALVANAVSTGSAGQRLEGRFLTVIGASGAGKSSMIGRAFGDLGGFENYTENVGTMHPLLRIEAHRPSSSKALATAILAALGLPVGRRLPARVAWEMVRANLELRQVVLLHIDEAQHCLRDGDEEAQLARDELKGLTQGAWPVSIVLSGLPSLEGFVSRDSQIVRRSTFFELVPLDRREDRDLVFAILKELAEEAGLKLSFPADYDVVDRLACAGCCQIGRVAKIVIHAAEIALEENVPQLDATHMARALRSITLCEDERNSFRAQSYALISHWPDDPEREEAPSSPSRKGWGDR